MEKIPYEGILKELGYYDLEPLKPSAQKRVFKAKHPRFDGTIIVKIGSYAYPKKKLDRIEREVLISKQIKSEYYPTHYDFRTFEDKKVFIIDEEFIDGRPLSDCFKEFNSFLEILCFTKELVEALEILWDLKIDPVHRDIKPDNILVTSEHHPRIIDLGIARVLTMKSLTETGEGTGICTREYAAPEQLFNRKDEIDYRTDQFLLGIIILQLLIHRFYRFGDNIEDNHPFNPELVRNKNSIEENIRENIWYRNILEEANMLPVKSLIEKLLEPETHKRFTSIDKLKETINACIKELV